MHSRRRNSMVLIAASTASAGKPSSAIFTIDDKTNSSTLFTFSGDTPFKPTWSHDSSVKELTQGSKGAWTDAELRQINQWRRTPNVIWSSSSDRPPPVMLSPSCDSMRILRSVALDVPRRRLSSTPRARPSLGSSGSSFSNQFTD